MPAENEDQNADKGNTDTAKDEQAIADKMYDGGKGDDKAQGKEEGKPEDKKSDGEGEPGDGKDDKKGDDGNQEQKSADELKAEADKKAEDEKKSDDEKKADALLPENFDYALPDGQTLTDENKETVIEIATAGKWTQEETTNVLTKFYEMRKAEGAVAQTEATQRMDGWREEIQNDPKIGGPKLAENLAKADSLISKIGTKAFYDEDGKDPAGKDVKKGDPIRNEKGIHLTGFGIMLQQTGVGSHPDFVRFMVDMGGMVTEDQIVTASASQAKKSMAETFYPNNP